MTAFYGERGGRLYRGEAKVFLADCSGAHHAYPVARPIAADQTRVTPTGERPELRGRAPSRQARRETLVLTDPRPY